MSAFDYFIPADIKPILDQVFADKEMRHDLDTVISEAALLLEAAAQNPATDKSLRDVFNNAAGLAPYAKKTLARGGIYLLGWPTRAVNNLYQDRAAVEKAFKDQGPEVSGMLSSLMDNNDVQAAFVRTLKKPAAQNLFTLEQDEKGQGYAVLQVNGLKFPLQKDNYNALNAVLNASKKPQPPKGPSA